VIFNAAYSSDIGFFVNFGEILYLAPNNRNTNDQEPELILTGNGIKKCVITDYTL